MNLAVLLWMVLKCVDFVGESSCSVAGGLEMVEIGSSDVDGLEMGVCNGHICWQLCSSNFCLVIQ